MNYRVQVGIVIAVCTLYGCGNGRPSLVKVTGKITMDGEPLYGAQVAFQPVTASNDGFQRPSTGFTSEFGTFVPQTYVEGDGLRVGKYRVAIVKQEPVNPPPKGVSPDQVAGPRVKYKWITPRKLSSPDTSGIEVEVTSSGMKPDTIEIKSVQPAEVD